MAEKLKSIDEINVELACASETSQNNQVFKLDEFDKKIDEMFANTDISFKEESLELKLLINKVALMEKQEEKEYTGSFESVYKRWKGLKSNAFQKKYLNLYNEEDIIVEEKNNDFTIYATIFIVVFLVGLIYTNYDYYIRFINNLF